MYWTLNKLLPDQFIVCHSDVREHYERLAEEDNDG
jgi:hypothetical protein